MRSVGFQSFSRQRSVARERVQQLIGIALGAAVQKHMDGGYGLGKNRERIFEQNIQKFPMHTSSALGIHIVYVRGRMEQEIIRFKMQITYHNLSVTVSAVVAGEATPANTPRLVGESEEGTVLAARTPGPAAAEAAEDSVADARVGVGDRDGGGSGENDGDDAEKAEKEAEEEEDAAAVAGAKTVVPSAVADETLGDPKAIAISSGIRNRSNARRVRAAPAAVANTNTCAKGSARAHSSVSVASKMSKTRAAASN